MAEIVISPFEKFGIRALTLSLPLVGSVMLWGLSEIYAEHKRNSMLLQEVGKYIAAATERGTMTRARLGDLEIVAIDHEKRIVTLEARYGRP